MAVRASTVLLYVAAILLLSVALTVSMGRNLSAPSTLSTSAAASLHQHVRLDRLADGLREVSRMLDTSTLQHTSTLQPREGSPPSTLSPPPPPPATIAAADYYEGNFLAATFEALPTTASGDIDVQAARKLLKSLLGMARLLNRRLVLPAALCACTIRHDDTGTQKGTGTVEQLSACVGPPAEPFGCPLREPLSKLLRLERWRAESAGFRPATFLTRAQSTSQPPPADLLRSHVRVLLPDGMSDGEVRYALRSYTDTRLLEVERAGAAYCGWDVRHDTKRQGPAFEAFANGLLEPADSSKSIFSARGGSAVALDPCTHFHGGAGEVQRFSNIGARGEHHNVSAPFEALPASVRRLPKGSDLIITFATGSVSTMALNWAATARKAGVEEILIGALDEQMMKECARANQPCVLIRGGSLSDQLTTDGAAQNLRSRPSLYPKMSVLKVGFYRELLSYGFNVWACDADAVLVGDPRPLMRLPEWKDAHVAAATDCIDIPLDNRSPLLHCDLNTGLVFMRSTAEVLDFVARWRETIASAKELRIRDQAAFNMLLKQRRLQKIAGGHRLYTASNGPGTLNLGVLPLARFLNGHTYFVQHAHTLPNAATPLVVHMTYQFAEGAKFAYGKRQRLRQAGLWLVDPDEYYNGRYVTVSSEGATLPPSSLPPFTTTSKYAISRHLTEARHRTKLLRNLLGVARALNRQLILPRMLCYCDFMWKEMKSCRVGGAETMRLPFECPMDHVYDTPRWFETPELGVTVRESTFLDSPRVPQNVSGRIARKVRLPRKGLSASEIRTALKPYEDHAIIELDDAIDAFCGFDDNAALDRTFNDATRKLLDYRRSPFCYEDHVSVPPYSQCCRPRKPGDAFFPCVDGFDPPEPLPKCGRA